MHGFAPVPGFAPLGSLAPTHTRTYRRLVEPTTINSRTLLSTDYLNHFNEFIMLLELVVDMPDMLPELQEWRAKSYAQHFRDSGFSHAELAIAAYDQVPLEYRQPFDRTIADLDRMIVDIGPAVAALATETEPGAGERIRGLTQDLRRLAERASAIINGAIIDETAGQARVMEQTQIDALFA